jgi:hypothetical protein
VSTDLQLCARCLLSIPPGKSRGGGTIHLKGKLESDRIMELIDDANLVPERQFSLFVLVLHPSTLGSVDQYLRPKFLALRTTNFNSLGHFA